MSIYGLILENTDADGCLRTYELPDDAGTSAEVVPGLRAEVPGAPKPLARGFAPGAQDGIASYHMKDKPVDEVTIANLIQEMSQVAKRVSPSLETTWGFKAQLEHAGKDASQVEFFAPNFESLAAKSFSIHNADAVLEAWEKTDPHRWETALLGALLATTSKERQAVKLGTALVGYAGANFWQEELTALGKHPEFTYWAVRALSETIGVPFRRTAALTEVFQGTEGWGKVRVLEALTENPDSEVRHWLLRSALDGDWLVGAYCALPVVQSAHLAEALGAKKIDDRLFEGATRLLNALLEDGGPNGSLCDYHDGLEAVQSWIRHARNKNPRPETKALADKLGSLRDYGCSSILEVNWGHGAVNRVIQEATVLQGSMAGALKEDTEETG